jgi:hypothetical protein
MKDHEYKKLSAFLVKDGVLLPEDQNAHDLTLINDNTRVLIKLQTPRDVDLHRVYFAFCSWLWLKMPIEFKRTRCPEKSQMYNYLKIIGGKYSFAMKYKGKEFYQFESISFSRMTNNDFLAYLNEQMGNIYTCLLVPLGLDDLFEEMEQEFKRLFKDLL